MKLSAILLPAIFFLAAFNAFAQNDFPPSSAAAVDNISREITKISNSLDELNKKLGKFSETFSSNQGLRLTDRQQQILFAFEILNRAETRLSTLQILNVQLTERLATDKRKIAQIDDQLRTENIDRTLGGTTDAETVRNNRRQALNVERNELSRLVGEMQQSISANDGEIRQTELFLSRMRRRIFPETEKELSDF